MAISSGSRSAVSSVTSDINVTPMADVMLVLLIIFMITTPLLQEGIYVNKPNAKMAEEAPDAEKEEATMVTVTRQKEVYINKQLVAEAEIVDQLTARVEVAPDLPIFIKGDVAAPYGKIVEIVNKARDSGVKKVGLMVDKSTQEQQR